MKPVSMNKLNSSLSPLDNVAYLFEISYDDGESYELVWCGYEDSGFSCEPKATLKRAINLKSMEDVTAQEAKRIDEESECFCD